jgi:hypothetical protein
MATNRKGRRNPPPFYLGQHIAQVASVAKQTGRELRSLDVQTPGNGYCIEVDRKTDVALAINGLGIAGEPILFAKLHYGDCALTFRFVPDEVGDAPAWRVTEVE